jgi:mono/diheme cytochrome c family protein
MSNHRFKLKSDSRTLCLVALACLLFLSAGCRMDMQDQPKAKVYRSSKFFKDGLSSRPLPDGTVPRGYLRADAALYTGKADNSRSQPGQNTAGGQSGQGAQGSQQQQGQQRQPGQGGGAMQSAGGNSPGSSSSGGANIYEGAVDAFPFPVTEELVNRGQERYQIFCAMCHGMTGYGDGMIVRRGFRKPPSYYDDNLRKAPVGHFYDVITNGWGAMPAYADQVPVQDRWAIVAYIRALQMTVPPAPQSAGGNQPQQQQTQQTGGQR